MSHEILSVLEYMEKEKGISRSDMIEAVSAAIASSAQKGENTEQNVKVEIDPKTGALKAWNILKVVDFVGDASLELNLEKARQIEPNAQVGDTVEKELDPAYLGRIAAQTA
ncbi:MAG: NusA N-terminal domain-containing protein, partial [Verrucomicrobiota bacterium]|nr:NusA N-terminal domain-containing protein [Verrucomicrobiota bacterium]